ncbi:hypothetical protein BVY03_05170 [bacterium K02(2017)]|nr:hypothetical protein BVY03_05170 [bacterium K02(2017)]
MRLKKPQQLKKGDLIRVVAPSSPFDKASFQSGVNVLKSWGFKVVYQKNIFSKGAYLAGSDQRRAKELITAINDPKAKAILFARGGYGSMRLISFLEKSKLNGPVKIVLGYSDITSINLYLQNRLGWGGFYGPVVAKDIHSKMNREAFDSLLACLTQKKISPIHGKQIKSLRSGKVSASLVGGCLTLVCASLGTSFEINTKNKILFLEDVNEKPYVIDRMLMQLKLAGKFDYCKGLIFGSLVGPNPDKHYVEAIKSVVKNYQFPILYNLPLGHGVKKLSIPLGVKVCLDTKSKSVSFLESAFK